MTAAEKEELRYLEVLRKTGFIYTVERIRYDELKAKQ